MQRSTHGNDTSTVGTIYVTSPEEHFEAFAAHQDLIEKKGFDRGSSHQLIVCKKAFGKIVKKLPGPGSMLYSSAHCRGVMDVLLHTVNPDLTAQPTETIMGDLIWYEDEDVRLIMGAALRYLDSTFKGSLYDFPTTWMRTPGGLPGIQDVELPFISGVVVKCNLMLIPASPASSWDLLLDITVTPNELRRVRALCVNTLNAFTCTHEERNDALLADSDGCKVLGIVADAPPANKINDRGLAVMSSYSIGTLRQLGCIGRIEHGLALYGRAMHPDAYTICKAAAEARKGHVPDIDTFYKQTQNNPTIQRVLSGTSVAANSKEGVAILGEAKGDELRPILDMMREKPELRTPLESMLKTMRQNDKQADKKFGSALAHGLSRSSGKRKATEGSSQSAWQPFDGNWSHAAMRRASMDKGYLSFHGASPTNHHSTFIEYNNPGSSTPDMLWIPEHELDSFRSAAEKARSDGVLTGVEIERVPPNSQPTYKRAPTSAAAQARDAIDFSVDMARGAIGGAKLGAEPWRIVNALSQAPVELRARLLAKDVEASVMEGVLDTLNCNMDDLRAARDYMLAAMQVNRERAAASDVDAELLRNVSAQFPERLRGVSVEFKTDLTLGRYISVDGALPQHEGANMYNIGVVDSSTGVEKDCNMVMPATMVNPQVDLQHKIAKGPDVWMEQLFAAKEPSDLQHIADATGAALEQVWTLREMTKSVREGGQMPKLVDSSGKLSSLDILKDLCATAPSPPPKPPAKTTPTGFRERCTPTGFRERCILNMAIEFDLPNAPRLVPEESPFPADSTFLPLVCKMLYNAMLHVREVVCVYPNKSSGQVSIDVPPTKVGVADRIGPIQSLVPIKGCHNLQSEMVFLCLEDYPALFSGMNLDAATPSASPTEINADHLSAAATAAVEERSDLALLWTGCVQIVQDLPPAAARCMEVLEAMNGNVQSDTWARALRAVELLRWWRKSDDGYDLVPVKWFKTMVMDWLRTFTMRHVGAAGMSNDTEARRRMLPSSWHTAMVTPFCQNALPKVVFEEDWWASIQVSWGLQTYLGHLRVAIDSKIAADPLMQAAPRLVSGAGWGPVEQAVVQCNVPALNRALQSLVEGRAAWPDGPVDDIMHCPVRLVLNGAGSAGDQEKPYLPLSRMLNVLGSAMRDHWGPAVKADASTMPRLVGDTLWLVVARLFSDRKGLMVLFQNDWQALVQYLSPHVSERVGDFEGKLTSSDTYRERLPYSIAWFVWVMAGICSNALPDVGFPACFSVYVNSMGCPASTLSPMGDNRWGRLLLSTAIRCNAKESWTFLIKGFPKLHMSAMMHPRELNVSGCLLSRPVANRPVLVDGVNVYNSMVLNLISTAGQASLCNWRTLLQDQMREICDKHRPSEGSSSAATPITDKDIVADLARMTPDDVRTLISRAGMRFDDSVNLEFCKPATGKLAVKGQLAHMNAGPQVDGSVLVKYKGKHVWVPGGMPRTSDMLFCGQAHQVTGLGPDADCSISYTPEHVAEMRKRAAIEARKQKPAPASAGGSAAVQNDLDRATQYLKVCVGANSLGLMISRLIPGESDGPDGVLACCSSMESSIADLRARHENRVRSDVWRDFNIWAGEQQKQIKSMRAQAKAKIKADKEQAAERARKEKADAEYNEFIVHIKDTLTRTDTAWDKWLASGFCDEEALKEATSRPKTAKKKLQDATLRPGDEELVQLVENLVETQKAYHVDRRRREREQARIEHENTMPPVPERIVVPQDFFAGAVAAVAGSSSNASPVDEPGWQTVSPPANSMTPAERRKAAKERRKERKATEEEAARQARLREQEAAAERQLRIDTEAAIEASRLEALRLEHEKAQTEAAAEAEVERCRVEFERARALGPPPRRDPSHSFIMRRVSHVGPNGHESQRFSSDPRDWAAERLHQAEATQRNTQAHWEQQAELRRQQQVAAAAPVIVAPPTLAALAGNSTAPPESTIGATRCIVCMEEDKDQLFLPCKHVLCCGGCAKKLMDTTRLCPTCRAPIKQVIGGLKGI
jgi:hypothetical protein